MHERSKIEEARYFLRQLEATGRYAQGLRPFTFQLSAFLSAARSILQYALKEARTKRGGEDWYVAAVQDELLTK